MIFTVVGFMLEGGLYSDFSRDIFADSPHDAMEIMLRRYSNLVVSGVCRARAG